MTYMGLDSDSLAYQVPPSHQEGAGQKAGLIFGNPYSGKTTLPLQRDSPSLPASLSPAISTFWLVFL